MPDEDQPVQLIEDEDTGDRFLVYGEKDGMRLDIKFQGETLWMTQAQIAQLFGRDQSVISRHIQNIFETGELLEQTSMQKMHKSIGRPSTIYDLDLIISVGYRVSSAQATAFRRWATWVLVQYAKKGFVVDSSRLKGRENRDRIKELREVIREIRSDEANLHAELMDICALCQDYQSGSDQALNFFKHTQAKLVFAVCSQTPAEVIASRADPNADNMGLQTWPNENIRKSDVVVSKNYLTEPEIRELNRLTSILLDIFEDQAEQGRLVVMSDAARLLDDQLKNLGRVVLTSGGQVTKTDADKQAKTVFAAFKEEQKAIRQARAKQNIAALAKEAKGI